MRGKALPRPRTAAFLAITAPLGILLPSSCTQTDPPWTVIAVDNVLLTGDASDDLGDFVIIVYGIVLQRGDDEIVLTYSQWPKNMPRWRRLDEVAIDTDLRTLRRNDIGFDLEDVTLTLVNAAPPEEQPRF